MEEFEYIIVGAGSAGCVLANRLSVDPHVRVLLLEAGGADSDPLIHIPLGLGRMHENRSHDWGYDVEAGPGMNGRALEAMRGKVVGGSSSINLMAHVRGNRGDYDRWAARGLPAWSYPHVLPYFRRCETWEGGASPYRGGDGPVSVIYARSRDPLFEVFTQAAKGSGIEPIADYNGPSQEGVGRGQFTISKGRRHSAASAYLRPAMPRKNLTLRTNAHALRVVVERHRARGVAYRRRGAVAQAVAAREVILCGGAFNSPQLLMLSGIGPQDELKRVGIDPLVHSAAVGANLQDHVAVVISAERPKPGPFQREMRFDRLATSMVRAYLVGTGPATSLPGGLHAFVKTEARLDAPDIQLLFRGVAAKPHVWFPGYRKPYADQCGIRPVLLHPESRGRVSLRSADPLDKVRIEGNFLAADSDLRTLRTGVRLARELYEDAALSSVRGAEISPGACVTSDSAIDEWIRRTAVTVHHPAGTCAMGADDTSVLDPQCRVRGVENLRVVDASAMPDLVSGNINACVLMIAEKASDLILGRAPLPHADAKATNQQVRI